MPKIVVIGGSAGAIQALKRILPSLPQDFPAAVLVVVHIGATSSLLPEILQNRSAMPVRHATDGEPIVPGRVLVAPPDEHLVVVAEGERAYVRLVHGPKENHCRPAIDPLFRSAASTFGPDAVGVLLTGYLDDGTVGLQAIKACGGITVVQHPATAEVPDMPASALEHVDVDQVPGLDQIGAALMELVAPAAQSAGMPQRSTGDAVPDWIVMENRMSNRDSEMEDLEEIGKLSSLTCPECNGALWEMHKKGPIRYRCHTGHAFTARVLESLQDDMVEDAIWGAIRALHEQDRLYTKMQESALATGNAKSAAEYQARAAQARSHSQSLREVIATRAHIAKRETT